MKLKIKPPLALFSAVLSGLALSACRSGWARHEAVALGRRTRIGENRLGLRSSPDGSHAVKNFYE